MGKRMRIFTSLVFCLILSIAAIGQVTEGGKAETFSATSLDGKSINLDELRGKVVVMTFWSTRCQICHEEIPKLNKIVEKYEGRDVVFMGLTMDNETRLELYLKKKPFKFTIMPNSLGVLLKYADRDGNGNPSMGYPAYFVIDQEGEIQHKSMGWDRSGKIDSLIGRLLSKSVAKAETPKSDTK
jgi:peroxiredoxin